MVGSMTETAKMRNRISELEALEFRLKKSEAALLELSDATASVIGDEFLKRMVSRIASVFKVRYAYITECLDDRKASAKILAIWMGTGLGDHFEYTLADTPCEAVIGGEVCSYPRNLQEMFPKDKILGEWKADSYIGVPLFHGDGTVIGHLAVLDDKPIDGAETMIPILKIFAKRAETEIQRRYSEKELERKKEELENINRIVQAINSELSIGGLLKDVLEETKTIKGVEKAAAILFDESSRMFKLASSTDPIVDLEKNIYLTPQEADSRYVQGNREIFEEIYLVKSIPGRAAEEKIIRLGIPKSMLVMRIRIRERVEGYFIFNNMTVENAFDHEDIALLKNLKEPILSAIIKIRMLEELKALNETKNEFLSMAAHDLRNPLQCIIGYAEFFMEDARQNRFDSKAAESDAAFIYNAGKRMMRMINELLDISIISSGKIKLCLQEENLVAVAAECGELHRRAAQKKNIQMRIEEESGLPKVMIDKTSMASVMDNLLSNAIKYTYPGGTIRVFFDKRPLEIVTHIQDTGQGLDENDLKRVFSNFGKLSAKPTGGETSTGLGLAIVKKIIEMHGGCIWVASEKGIGSTFSFSLPVTA